MTGTAWPLAAGLAEAAGAEATALAAGFVEADVAGLAAAEALTGALAGLGAALEAGAADGAAWPPQAASRTLVPRARMPGKVSFKNVLLQLAMVAVQAPA